MAARLLQYADELVDAALDARVARIGAAPTLELRSGEPPARCASADTGRLLAAGVLPAVWMAPARDGRKAKAGIWMLEGLADGTPGHFRIKQGGRAKVQGRVTKLDAGGPMEIDRDAIQRYQRVEVLRFELRGGNR